MLAVRPLMTNFTLPAGVFASVNEPFGPVVVVRSGRPRIEIVAPEIGSKYLSSAVISEPSGPARASSVVNGFRSGPGSRRTPDTIVPRTEARLTVLKPNSSSPPLTPSPSPSRTAPSNAVIFAPLA